MIERACPCKVNLILDILGKRPDGFHELETILYPVPYFDLLQLEEQTSGISLSCTQPNLPVDKTNLVYRAAELFLAEAGIRQGTRIHLEKRIPLAAGLGGGSSNAAHTLQGLNELFGHPLPPEKVRSLAESLGSDVPFFLEAAPALATGRGERITLRPFFPALRGTYLFLVYPGFGVSTAWAYGALGAPEAPAAGKGGRAKELAQLLETSTLSAAAKHFYNSLEKLVLKKYPLLGLYQKFLREAGAAVALMSGSGSTTFALFEARAAAEEVQSKFVAKFGTEAWLRMVPMMT